MKLNYGIVNKNTRMFCALLSEPLDVNDDSYILNLKDFPDFKIEASKCSRYKHNINTNTIDLVPIEVDTPAETIESIRFQRNLKLADSDKEVLRYLSEKDLVTAGLLNKTTITDKNFLDLRVYQQKLRDMMKLVTEDNANSIIFPVLNL